MQINDFKYYNELYNKKNFTKVAKHFNISQPSISSAIKRLENFFQVKLVIRGNTQSELVFTPSGEQLHQHTVSILNELDSAKNELDLLKSRTTTIGLPPILKNAYFTKIAIAAREFDRQFNINNMAIYEAGSNYLKQALMAGEIDIALLGALNVPQDDELLIIPFVRANFCVYISKNNPLSEKPHLYFSDLQKQAFVALDSSFVHNQAIKKMSQQAGFRPKYFMKTNDIHFLMNMISENLGVAILTDIVKTTSSDIVVLPLLDDPQPFFTGSIAFRKNHLLTNEEKMLVDTLSK